MGAVKAILVVGILAVCGLLASAETIEIWSATAIDGTNVVFMANMSMEFNAQYTKKGDKTATKVNFDFTTENSNLTTTLSNSSTISLKLTNPTRQQSVSMTFSNTGKEYSLTKFQVEYVVLNATFPNATKLNVNGSAKMSNAKDVFQSKLDTSYQCTMDTEIELDATEGISSAWFKFGGIQLEAFLPKKTFSPASSCFADIPRKALVGDYQSIPCIRMKTSLMLDYTYSSISGSSITTQIPLPEDANVTCNTTVKDTASVHFLVDTDVSLNMVFMTNTTMKNYHLSTFALSYDSMNRYFPNHKYMKNSVVVSNSTLELFPTTSGESFQCDVKQTFQFIKKSFIAEFDHTQLQVFNAKNDSFDKSTQCPQMQTTPQTPVTTPGPDPLQPTSNTWKVMDKKNNTCFLAMTGIQVRARYNTTTNMTDKEVWFDYSANNTKVSPVDACDKDEVVVEITETARNQTLTMTFSKTNNKTMYALTNVQLKMVLTNLTFPGAKAADQTVLANATGLNLMETPLNNSYSCTTETQIKFQANDIDYVVLRLTDISGLQAFLPGKNLSQNEKCFTDKTPPAATEVDWLTNQTAVCARIKSTFSLRLQYYDIMGTVQSGVIPVQGNKSKVISSKCTANMTSITVALEGSNLTMGFITTNNGTMYALDTVQLEYANDNPYFPNHMNRGMGSTAGGSSLNYYKTPLKYSYRCDLPQQSRINNLTYASDSLTVMWTKSMWESFGINKTGDFSEAKLCAEEVTTPMPATTVPATTVQPVVPTKPIPRKYFVADSKNNKTICLLADIGLQLRTEYIVNSTYMDISFGFDVNKTTAVGTCNGIDSSQVTFTDSTTGQSIALTFMVDSASNKAALTKVQASYTINTYFPHANATTVNQTYTLTSSDLNEMVTMKNGSFKCDNADTDVYVTDGTHTAVIRIVGLQVQAFDIVSSKTFSKEMHCFADEIPKLAANVGNWTITDKNNTVCAKYMFSLVANVTYTDMIGNIMTTRIPLDNSSDYNGACGNSSSYFSVNMDDEKVVFLFMFHRNYTGKDTYNFYLQLVTLQYNSTSKFFPNHEGQNAKVELSNSSLTLFQSTQDHSYKCVADNTVRLNDMLSYVDFKDVQVQPFDIAKNSNAGFSAADDCVKDNDDLSPIIPIIVGAVLAGLIVIVMVAYFIGRARSAKPEYETI